jgi:hypothetical protein
MTRVAKIRTQRYTWADKVARWRSQAPQHRAAIERGTTRYYFAVARFVHCIEVGTVSQMEVNYQWTGNANEKAARWPQMEYVAWEYSAT